MMTKIMHGGQQVRRMRGESHNILQSEPPSKGRGQLLNVVVFDELTSLRTKNLKLIKLVLASLLSH